VRKPKIMVCYDTEESGDESESEEIEVIEKDKSSKTQEVHLI
jgi:hypothetical protein